MTFLLLSTCWPPCSRPFSCGRGAGRRSWSSPSSRPPPSAWTIAQLAAGHRRGRGPARRRSWVPALDLEISLRLDALSLTFAAAGHRGRRARAPLLRPVLRARDDGIGRFAGDLVAFAGSMLGLVLADDMLLLYVFWELTTVFSFLLIGGGGSRLAARRAASQALILTTAGGLAMLVGILLVGRASGSYLLSEVVASPRQRDGDGRRHRAAPRRRDHQVGAGAVPLLAARRDGGAHPGQRVPARGSHGEGRHLPGRPPRPGFADVPGWRPIVLGLGAATMLVGGYRALRQTT